MKLLSKDLLVEYGFIRNNLKTNNILEIMSRNEFDICIKFDGSIYSSFNGKDYTLKDIAALRKLYKEVNKAELKPVY